MLAASCSALICRSLSPASVTAAGAPPGAGDLCLTTAGSSQAHLDSAEMRCKERLVGKVTQPLLDDQMNNQEQPVGTGSFSEGTNSKSPTEDARKVPGSPKDSSEV